LTGRAKDPPTSNQVFSNQRADRGRKVGIGEDYERSTDPLLQSLRTAYLRRTIACGSKMGYKVQRDDLIGNEYVFIPEFMPGFPKVFISL
jgi:hypothetical protein